MLIRLILIAALSVPLSAWAQGEMEFVQLAKSAGTPQIPGIHIVYLAQLGDPAKAPWKNIILHQTEGTPGSTRALAEQQAGNPTKRGVTMMTRSVSCCW